MRCGVAPDVGCTDSDSAERQQSYVVFDEDNQELSINRRTGQGGGTLPTTVKHEALRVNDIAVCVCVCVCARAFVLYADMLQFLYTLNKTVNRRLKIFVLSRIADKKIHSKLSAAQFKRATIIDAYTAYSE